MSHTRTLLSITAAAVVVLTPAAASVAATSVAAPHPKLLQAELVTAPEIAHGTSAIVFRTDHKLARGSNGGTLKGRAGLAGKGSSSIGTAKGPKGHPCYVGYLPPALKVGHEYKVVITIGSTDYHRTLRLKKPTHVADRGGDLGC